MRQEALWCEDPMALIGRDFVPMPWMTLEEKLNSLLRLSVLFAVGCAVLCGGSAHCLVPALIAGGTALYSFLRPACRRSRREGLSGKAETPCSGPTRDNPYMNRLPLGEDRGPACDLSDRGVSEFADGMLDLPPGMSAGDKRAAVRTFYTTPSTASAPEFDKFGSALFGGMPGKRL